MADITFYTNPMSRGRIVHWLLEARRAVRRRRSSISKREHKSPSSEDQSDGQGAAIVHRGTVV
jgi:hypothetical protein